jgi:Ras-related protein Rab-1A
MSMYETDYDYLFKIILIGDSGIGKSAILFRFADDIYNESYISTIGVDFKIKTIFINGKVTKLQIWDTAGQERFRTITTSYYRGSHIIFLCYDITDRESFNNLEMWEKEIKKYGSPNVKVVLCGTKNDLSNKRQISYEEGKNYASKHNYDFYETSAKNNQGIDELFEKSSELLMNDFLIQLNKKNKIADNKSSQISVGLKVANYKKTDFIKNCC